MHYDIPCSPPPRVGLKQADAVERYLASEADGVERCLACEADAVGDRGARASGSLAKEEHEQARHVGVPVGVAMWVESWATA